MGVTSSTSSTSTHEAAIGTFVIDRFGNQNASDEIDLTLRDFSSKLNFGLPFAVSWDENEPIENIIEDLATGGGITSSQLNLPLTGINTEAERAFTAGTDRWRAMYEIASANAYDLYFDADGVLQMDPFTDPATASPQFTFRVGGGSNVASIGRKISPALIR
ncbi:MAG: hypothetical protein GY724_09405, partial [Actinomycetia bacterium]|nr:hypothetical protein [Actinomycetes bacterium]